MGRREDADLGALPIPACPPTPRRAVRVEFESEPRGALQDLAACDVDRAKLFGRCDPTTGVASYGRLVAEVMNQLPHATTRRVFWAVDNGSSHGGQTPVERLRRLCRCRHDQRDDMGDLPEPRDY